MILHSVTLIASSGHWNDHCIEVLETFTIKPQLARSHSSIRVKIFVLRREWPSITGLMMEVSLVGCDIARSIILASSSEWRGKQNVIDHPESSLAGVDHCAI